MNLPTISVIMPTYNHAQFVTQAINSVLEQCGVDFEFLIADDGSSDNTREVVASIEDKRISFFPNEINRGACVVTNELIARASGEFIALINSDDYWISNDKLAKQLNLMRDKPNLGACFGKASFVDKDGQLIDNSKLGFGKVFEKNNRSRGEWLRYFFDHGNCLCHPTILIRKSCYTTLGFYDNRMRQLPDFDMWVRLLKHYDIHIFDEEMIAFRNLPGENASCINPSNARRSLFETYLILKRFFDDMPLDVFTEGFRDLMVKAEIVDDAQLDIEKCLLFLHKDRWGAKMFNLIGLEKINSMLCMPYHRKLLTDQYSIDDRTFHTMASESDLFDLVKPTVQLSGFKLSLLINEIRKRFKKSIKSFLST